MKAIKLILSLTVAISALSCTQKPGGWEFHYPGDKFTEDALLDLRYLNESIAGEHGFTGLSEDGRSFVRGDGEPIRFWPVNGGGSTAGMSDEDLAWHARFLAKQGVNMNRWHGSINPAGKGTDIFEIDTAEVHNIWRFVAAMNRWTYSTPGGIAQFPAYALLFRKGYIAEGETMIHEDVSFDPNRDQLEGIKTEASAGGLSPLAFLTGPVEAVYGGDPAGSFINAKLAELIDLEKGTVKSITGELTLDYQRGIFTLNSPKAVGVSGFVKSHGTFLLGDITIESENDYVTVGVVSMDGLPLSESRKILIQSGTLPANALYVVLKAN